MTLFTMREIIIITVLLAVAIFIFFNIERFFK